MFISFGRVTHLFFSCLMLLIYDYTLDLEKQWLRLTAEGENVNLKVDFQ